jgi:hypothetical protein
MGQLLTIPAERPFLPSLAGGLLRETPERLADHLILLPSRRACLELRDTFLGLTTAPALLLPRLQPVGEVDLGDLPLPLLADSDADHAPPIDALRRRLLLARLVKARADMPDEQAIRLATALAELLDLVQTERCSLHRLDELIPDGLADHWREVVRFLGILDQAWPAILADEGAVDPAMWRNARLAAATEALRREPPARPGDRGRHHRHRPGRGRPARRRPRARPGHGGAARLRPADRARDLRDARPDPPLLRHQAVPVPGRPRAPGCLPLAGSRPRPLRQAAARAPGRDHAAGRHRGGLAAHGATPRRRLHRHRGRRMRQPWRGGAAGGAPASSCPGNPRPHGGTGHARPPARAPGRSRARPLRRRRGRQRRRAPRPDAAGQPLPADRPRAAGRWRPRPAALGAQAPARPWRARPRHAAPARPPPRAPRPARAEKGQGAGGTPGRTPRPAAARPATAPGLARCLRGSSHAARRGDRRQLPGTGRSPHCARRVAGRRRDRQLCRALGQGDRRGDPRLPRPPDRGSGGRGRPAQAAPTRPCSPCSWAAKRSGREARAIPG